MIVTWFHNIKLLGKAAGCAQHIMAQEMLTNLNLEKSCFYKNLVLWAVIYSQNRTQSPWEFQKEPCTRQLAGTFSSYPYMGFEVCLQSRISKPARYLFTWSVIWTYLFRRVSGYSSGSVSSLRVQDGNNPKPRLSLVSVQSFCVVSPHMIRAASLLPAHYYFCRVKMSYTSAIWICGSHCTDNKEYIWQLHGPLPQDTRFHSKRNGSDLRVILWPGI